MGSGDCKISKSAPISGIHCHVCQMWTLVPGPENYSTFFFLSTQAPPHRINYLFSSFNFCYYEHDWSYTHWNQSRLNGCPLYLILPIPTTEKKSLGK